MNTAGSPVAVPEPYSLRIQKLREEMVRHKLDAYFVQNRTDQYWLTGFTGEDGAVVVTQRGVTFLTDGRFDEAANREASAEARQPSRRSRGWASTRTR